MELNNLGHQKQHVFKGANPELLETIPWEWDEYSSMEVTIETEEFTTVCPVTGGPDFGKVIISYEPRNCIIESKSLKYYLESYRDEKMFHEAAIQQIIAHLTEILKPLSICVAGDFRPRGGLAIKPKVSWEQ